jgi:DNA-binding transcriptional ArsR family regulator
MNDGNGTGSAIIPGCDVLPPLDPVSPSGPPSNRGSAKPKEKPGGRPAAGRFAEINAFIDVTARGLELSQFAVWVVLWRDTKPNGLARTSTADLARRAGVSRRTVLRAVKALTKAGLLIVVRVGNLRAGPSVYRVRPTPAR